MKQRINVLLVPNKTLETPNYRLERLKHDDPRLDNIEASYKMAEEIEDPTTVTRRSQEKHNKQEPIIKGVLPDAPAPIAPPKAEIAPIAKVMPVPEPVQTKAPAERGLFDWIKGLFGGTEAPAKPAAAATSEVMKDDREGDARREAARDANRDGRGERGGRDGRRGGRGRNERGDRPEGRTDQRTDGRPEAKGNERRERSPEQRGEQRTDQRNEQRSDQRNEGQEQREPRAPREPREPREGGRQERPRRERAERGEQRPPMDATEQDIALANKAAMAAAMGGANTGAHGVDAGQEAPRRERGDRGDRDRRNERRDEPQGESRAEPRADRQNFNDAVPAEPTHGTDANGSSDRPVQGDQADNQRPPRERRSRDRYGRERRERSEGVDRNETGTEMPVSTENAVSNESSDQKIRVQVASELIVPVAMPVVAVKAVQSAPVSAKALAVDAPLATALPKVTSYDLPLQDLSQIAQDSGLQWVNSNASKIAEAQAAIAAEVKPAHVPRARPPALVSDEAPLVLVETKRDLRAMELPFEKSVS